MTIGSTVKSIRLQEISLALTIVGAIVTFLHWQLSKDNKGT
jgi:hypothetical protein